MKKRIYKINNKNLVTGNPNEVTENEILVKENNDGTVELSHRNNGTLETLGSGGNGGGSEPKNILDIPNITFNNFTEGAVTSANVTSQLNLYDLTNVDGIRTNVSGNQMLFKLVEDVTFGNERIKTYLFLLYGGMIFFEIIVSFNNNSFAQAVSVVGQASMPL